MTWKDISIKKYLEIQDILNDAVTSDEDKAILIANTIYERDITELPIPEYQKKMRDLAFVNEAPQNENLANSYTVNGTKYKSNANIETIQANQFIDF